MTDIFTASNGITVEVVPDEHLVAKGYADAGPLGIDALREYFTHERDKELGRWRDTENPNVVVYPADPYGGSRCVRVMDEGKPGTIHVVSEGIAATANDSFAQAAARYFDANPEKKTWEKAEEGETWLITCSAGYENTPAIVKDGRFCFPNRYGEGLDCIDLAGVTTATRIWPTETDDE